MRAFAIAVLLGATALAGQQPPPRARFPVAERFRQLDRNGDGKLSADELPRPELHAQIDANGNGSVTLDEVRAFFAARGRRPAAPPPVPPMTTHLNVPYAKAEGVAPRLLSLDIYAPKDAKGCPVMLYVHGGGWSKGDKQAVGQKPAWLVGKGWMLVSANYRLVPKIAHPANVQDVANAIAWVHTNAAKHGGDPARIFLMGHSAGAHLVSLAAIDGRRLEAAGKSLSILKGVIELDTAALDLPRLMRESLAVGRVYGPAFGKDPAVWKDASPMAHIAKDKGIPPFLLIHADRNPMKEAQSEAFAKALDAAGIRAEVVAAPDKTHGTLNRDLGRPGDKPTAAVDAFLDSLLAPKQ